jgi:hypothetical protein
MTSTITENKAPLITWWQNILENDPPEDQHELRKRYWSTVSRNPNIKMHMVVSNLDKPWDWYYLSINKGIRLSDISNNPDMPWDWEAICDRNDLTLKFFEKNKDKFNTVHIELLSCASPSSEIELIVCKYPDLDWEYGEMGVKDGLSYINFHIDTILKLWDKPWDWYELSFNNPNISIDDIINNPELPWSFYGIHRRKDITLNDIIRLVDVYPVLLTKYYLTHPDKLINTIKSIKNK